MDINSDDLQDDTKPGTQDGSQNGIQDGSQNGIQDGTQEHAGSAERSSEFRPEYRKKAIRSYVVRAGRMTEGQRNAFSSGWSFYGLKLDDGPIDAETIFGRKAPLIVEIGVLNWLSQRNSVNLKTYSMLSLIERVENL